MGFQLEFVTSSGVFSHKRIDNGTRLLVESMVLPSEGRVLDLGCGYGVIGITAAKKNPDLRVWMTDVNSACRCPSRGEYAIVTASGQH